MNYSFVFFICFVISSKVDIDKLLDDQEHIIKLLKEKRSVLITQAVTKGLDPNVQMKNTNSIWIDSIPEFDFATMESQTNKNYDSLISGEEIAVEVKVEKVKKTAKDMFLSKGKVETGKVKGVKKVKAE